MKLVKLSKKLTKYTPEICHCCSQDKTYELGLDKGSAIIVWQIAKFIRQKGYNIVHPRKEMEGKYLTSNQVGNLSRPRFHGLIAAAKNNPGNYVLTRKGAEFLRGAKVPRIAIVEKAKAGGSPHNIGYHLPNEEITTLRELVNEKTYWQGIDYTIEEGRIIKDNDKKPVDTLQAGLF